MAEHHRSIVIAGLAAALALSAPGVLKSAEGDAQLASKEWATVSGDLGNTRYSTLTQINSQTIGRLAGAWTSKKFDAVGAGRAMPVVKDGMLFITVGSSIYAYNAKDGATVWQHQTDVPPETAALSEYNRSGRGLPNREGVAVAEGLVFAGLTNARVIALREKTGEVAWDVYVGIEPARAGQGVSGAPVYANGLVFVGTAGDAGFRGKVIALDAQTGRKAWEWFVVPGPGEKGHETVAEKLRLVEDRRRRRLARWRGGSRPGSGLLRHRQRRAAVRRRHARRRQPVSLLRRGARDQNRQAALVLPDDPPRYLGSRHRGVARAVRRADRRPRAEGDRGDAHRRLSVHARPGDRKALDADRRAQGAAGPAQPYRVDTAVSRRRRARAARLHGVAEAADPIGLRARLLFCPGLARHPQPADACVGHACGADGLQPADRLFLRHRQRLAPMVPAGRRSLHLHPRGGQGAGAAAGPPGDGGD